MTQTTTFPVPQIVQAQFQRVDLLVTKELETIRKEAMQYNINRIPGKGRLRVTTKTCQEKGELKLLPSATLSRVSSTVYDS